VATTCSYARIDGRVSRALLGDPPPVVNGVEVIVRSSRRRLQGGMVTVVGTV